MITLEKQHDINAKTKQSPYMRPDTNKNDTAYLLTSGDVDIHEIFCQWLQYISKEIEQILRDVILFGFDIRIPHDKFFMDLHTINVHFNSLSGFNI